MWNKTTGIPIKSDSKVGSTKSIPTALSRTVLNALFHYLLSDKKNVEALVAQANFFKRERFVFIWTPFLDLCGGRFPSLLEDKVTTSKPF